VKRVLLTGATGFLGSHLLESLLAAGHEVVILKRSTSDTWRINNLLGQVKSYDVDVQNIELAFKEKRVDVVIHTACIYGRKGETTAGVVESNLMFGLRVLDACLKYNVGLFCNTDTLLKNNLNDYSLSKSQFAAWLKQKSDKVQIANLKLEHMYGPKDDDAKLAPWLLSQLREDIPEINLTSGEQKRDFIYIDDVVSAYMKVLEQEDRLKKYSEFEVGTGKSIAVKLFIESLRDSYENRFGKSSSYLNFGAIIHRDGEVMNVQVDNSALITLGWKPKTLLKQGLCNMLEAYQ